MVTELLENCFAMGNKKGFEKVFSDPRALDSQAIDTDKQRIKEARRLAAKFAERASDGFFQSPRISVKPRLQK